jgi:quinol-cytochrome oxidoreductase complex cytochrome b subunit
VTIGVNVASSPQEVTDALGVTHWIDPGSLQRRLLLGADEIGDSALVRFYFLHCVLLPLLTGILVAVHLWRVRRDGGLSRPDAEDREPPSTTMVDTLPHAFVREFAACMLILALTLGLAYLLDAPLREPADPAVSENPAKSPWYFLGLQELIGYSAFMGGIGVPTLVLLGLALIPYLDRDGSDFGVWFGGAEARRAAVRAALFAAACCVGFLYVTVRYGWLRGWFPGLPQSVVMLINPGTLLVLLFAVWSLRAVRKYDSIRAGAVALFTCFFVGFVLLTYFASVHRGPNWNFYWWPSLWPTF